MRAIYALRQRSSARHGSSQGEASTYLGLLVENTHRYRFPKMSSVLMAGPRANQRHCKDMPNDCNLFVSMGEVVFENCSTAKSLISAINAFCNSFRHRASACKQSQRHSQNYRAALISINGQQQPSAKKGVNRPSETGREANDRAIKIGCVVASNASAKFVRSFVLRRRVIGHKEQPANVVGRIRH